ncbi:hypothetical protein CANTEDRAFT_119040 [Yamadazyma tenuis ATCC 10573]|uniref:Zn(2)-C6 fungal-type domain-containing protein n=1 Tax=Candida tenuis (strain ATCC 10573 / BCRC 21748 / CBS 615 / JCM 9827 / NBRC 10315 / NRRL Y-1498 / VKM Y-70) TaxID=590646 RepID=G3AZ37_CANTC|nr:uncharacterized protein CANTEDRAFT_119040 [Yamadazyma tenuis ATCC 10573]XP_006684573.1 uncharacterized protein CANTEDRAFT_119040 [Yamadazyma tenuis ATCC 10573]EGV65998.1 hypothetical protein CANTEDRAFT_119040 [Yamadazyma tenuis ATCC 10573]EGV65999.1 hypothetical protein CANTEDRAFT_119040 [Yamadazyma tenuis ATCC 10573]
MSKVNRPNTTVEPSEPDLSPNSSITPTDSNNTPRSITTGPSSTSIPPATKRKNTKSRNGCLTCKKKRLKCDETKPSCLKCLKKNIACGGYATRFKWRSFNDESTAHPHTSPSTLRRHLELASISVTGKSIKDIKRENDLIEEGINPATYNKRRRQPETTSKSNAKLSFSSNSSINPNMISEFRRQYTKTGSVGLNSLAEAAIDEINTRSSDIYRPHPGSIPTMSPTISDFLTPAARSPEVITNKSLKPHLNQHHHTQLTMSNPSFQNIHLSPTLSALINSAFGHDEDLRHNSLFDEEINPGGSINGISTPLTVSVKSTPIYNVGSNSSMLLTAEQEQILGLYSQYTAEILSIKNGPNENPWRKLILPYALQYSCLFNSIASITLFHMAGNEGIATNRNNLRTRGYMYMKRCILELASGLSASTDGTGEPNQQLPADIAIAICLNLAVSETWDKHTSSGIAHLKGAKTMIQNVLALLKENQNEMCKKRRKIHSNGSTPKDTEEYGVLVNSKRDELKKRLVLVEDSEWDKILTGEDEVEEDHEEAKPDLLKIPKSTQFLFNIWIYFEVLAQMTTESDEKGIDLVASITTILQDSKKKEGKGSKFLEDKLDRSPDVKSESSESTLGNVDTFGGIHRGFNNLFDNFENISLNSDYVDPLLGCAQSLFSIMGKVASLISNIRKIRKKDKKLPDRNTLTTITRATQLRQDLLSWKPTISASMLEQMNAANNADNTKTDLSSCIATAEAYRFATLLYLHQAVPEIPSLSSHQLAEKIFILLASIPTTSPTYTVHIFPLLVSSCEAELAEEREWCEERWRILSSRLWIGNVDRAFEVVKEVWKRKDDYIRKKQINSLSIDDVFIPHGTGNDNEKFKNISTQLSGLMAAINESCPVDDITGGIYSKLHWSTIMKEWGWEVLLG